MSDILRIDYATCSLLGARVCVCAHTHIHTPPCMCFFQTLTVPQYLQLSPCFIERLRKEQKGKIPMFLVVFFFFTPQDLLPPKAAYTGCQFVQRSCRVLLILSGFMSIAKCVPGIISFPFLSFFFFLCREQHGEWKSGYRQTWVLVLILPLTCCVTLVKSISFSLALRSLICIISWGGFKGPWGAGIL